MSLLVLLAHPSHPAPSKHGLLLLSPPPTRNIDHSWVARLEQALMKGH